MVNFTKGEKRNTSMAFYAPAVGRAASIGLVAGGFFADVLSWRVGFFVNEPVRVTLFALVYWLLPSDEGRREPLDLIDAITSTLGIGLNIWGPIHAGEVGWTRPGTVAAVGGGTLVTVFFFLYEARKTSSILPLRLFRQPERAAS